MNMTPEQYHAEVRPRVVGMARGINLLNPFHELRSVKDDQIDALRQILADTRSELQKLGYSNLRLIGENDRLARERDALAMRLAELAKAGAAAQKQTEKAPEPTDTRGADLLAAIQTMQGLGIR